MALGDQVAQNFVEKRNFKDLDFVRTSQFFGIGFCVGVSKIINKSKMLN